MKTRVLLLVLLFAFGGARLSCALDPARPISQYALMKWGASSLPGSSIRAIAQTPDHYLWLGTSAGLVRFDGATFVHAFEGNPAAGEGGVATLATGRDGALFYGTASGRIVRVHEGRFAPIQHDAGAGTMSAMFVDRDGTLWFSLFGRGVRWWSGEGAARSAGREKPVPLAFVQEPSGRVLFGTEHNGLCAAATATDMPADDRCIPDGGVPVASLPRLMGRPDAVQALYADRGGALWMGTPNGLFRWHHGELRRFGLKDGLSHEDIRAILEDADGNIWVGTSGGGLNRRTAEGRWTSFSVVEGLSDNDVRSLFEDHERNLWVATADGLNCFSNPRVVTYGRVEGLGDQIVQSIAPGAGGTVWIGSMTGTVLRLRGDTIEKFPLPLRPGHRSVLSIREARDGSVWARANNRLFRLESGVAREHAPPGRVTAIAVDDEGLLFGIKGYGLARFDGRRFVRDARALPPLQDDYIHFIHPARDGTLWVTSPHALVHLHAGASQVYAERDGLPGSRVRWISEDADGSLWLACEGGLAHLKDGRIRALTLAHGLPESYLRIVLDDERGHLWLTSQSRLFRLAKQDVHDVLAGRRTKVVPVGFDMDGLETTEWLSTNDPGFRSADGRLWFASARGVVLVDPARLSANEPAPRVHIQRLTVDGHVDEPTPGKEFHYGPGRGNVEIDYAILRFRAARAMRVRYRLEGFSDEWVEIRRGRRFFYSKLAPGSYTFSIEASDRDGRWTGAPTTLRFSIDPPFYRTGVFYAAAALVVGAALTGAHRLRVRRMRTRFAAILGERTRIARELHDTLAQGLAGTAIQLDAVASLLPGRPEAAQDAVSRAKALVRASLDEVRRSIWVLRAQTSQGPGGLGPALSESLRQLAEPSGLVAEVRIDGDVRPLPADVERHLLRIAHEAVTNAARHSEAKRLTVDLAFARDGVCLTVRDDGRGFDPDAWLGRGRGDHFGLLGMHERARGLGGELRVSSRVGEGTELVCRLPYRDHGAVPPSDSAGALS